MSNFRQPVRATGLSAGSEDGFILLAVLFLVVLLLIAIAIAAPAMARSIQRDKELELIHRGEQYKRAIKLYYKKFNAYPTSIDQLVDTNNIRFLRKRYKDPITGQDDWRLIHLGEAKVPPMGPFGQPLMALPGQPGAGLTPGGGTTGISGPPGSPAFASPNSGTSGTSGTDSFGSTNFGSDSGTTGSPTEVPNATLSNMGSQPGTPGTTNGTSTTSSSAFGAGIGGGPIVGVGIPVDKASLIEYKKQKKYSLWEFVYNPIEEQLQAGAALGGGTPNPTGTNGTGVGNNSGFGPSSTTGSFGTSSGSFAPGPTNDTGPAGNPSSSNSTNPPQSQ